MKRPALFFGILFICAISKILFAEPGQTPLFNLSLIDTMHYVWAEQNNTNTEIYYARWNGTKWTKALQITNNTHNDFSPCLALDKKGNPWIVWSGEDGISTSIYTRHWNGKKWTGTEQVSDIDIYEDTVPAITFDSKNRPWVIWCRTDGTDDDIYASRLNGKNWSAPEMVNDNDNTPDIDPVISLDKQGNLLAVWCGYNGTNYQLYFSRRINRQWIYERPVFSKSFFASSPSLLRQRNNNLKLLWHQLDGNYKTVWNGKDWSQPQSNNVFIPLDVFNRLNAEAIGPGYIIWSENGINRGIKFYYTIPKTNLVTKRKGSILNILSWLEEKISPSASAAVEPNKYIAFGDSVTWGYGAQTEGYPPRLERKLNKEFGPSIVINEGIGGERTTSGMARINSVLSKDNAEYILIMEGTNDLLEHSVDTIMFDLGQMVDRSKKFGTTPLLALLSPRRDSLDKHIRCTINPDIVKLAEEKNITSVDQYTEIAKDKDGLMFDHVHPNDAGYEIMSRVWFDAIKQLRKPASGGGNGCGAVPPISNHGRNNKTYGILFTMFILAFILFLVRRHYSLT